MLYDPLVPFAECWSIIISFADIVELVKTKDTVVLAANAAPFMVIRPVGVFRVTPVDLFVA